MLLRPTAKAHRELHPGLQTLTMRQRSVLLLASHEPAARLQRLFNGMGEQIVCDLLAQGYLVPDTEAASAADTIRKSDATEGIEPTHEDL